MRVEFKEAISKDEFQKKLALRAFFDCAGFKEFKAELDIANDYACDTVEKLQASAVKMDDLSKLNFMLGEKSGFKQILQILKNLEEELEDNSPQGKA